MTRPQAAGRERVSRRGSLALICALLVAATLAVHLQTIGFDFTNFDDDVYVTESAHVRAGLAGDSIAWAFTTFYGSNWHPITWLSLMLDAEIGGVSPRTYHATNVLLHLANVLLLFVVLRRMTGAIFRPALVAALFGVHPLHVESVAWVAERKDVLSTLFLLLTLLAYARWVERPGGARSAGVLALFALGLMAKPMLVTLPCLLLLLDVWPLARRGVVARLLEKAPLLGMSVASCVVTIVAQHRGGALKDLELYPLALRVANALVATVTYLGKTVWPSELSVFYPYPRQGLHPAVVTGAALLLLAATAGAIVAVKRRPWLTVGWLWYLVTLVPVIGLVQVGAQAMADRYTYVALIGVFVIVAWGGAEIADTIARRAGIAPRTVRVVLVATTTAVVAALGTVAALQARHWRNGVTLFEHAVAVSPNNALAENNLGGAWFLRGELAPATEHFEKAHALDPDYADAAANLAGVLLQKGELDRVIRLCTRALERSPQHWNAHSNLGFALLERGQREDAARHFRDALRVRPDHAGTNAGLGIALFYLGDVEQAIAFLGTAARIAPDAFEARFYFGAALIHARRFEEAAAQLAVAVRIRPADPLARQYLEAARARGPLPSEATPAR